jgi:hypothetical protein
MADVLRVPESLFMLFNKIVAVDHFFQVHGLYIPEGYAGSE